MMKMTEKFNKLFETVKFPNGATINSRFVMSPMVVNGSSYEGNVGDDIKYFERRADSASLLITGATSVTPDGNTFGYGLGLYDDSQVEGWKKLAMAMKSKGNRALVQIYHPGY
jgi:NADH:flavin oxidoreductase/NADH oxidase